MYMQAVLKCSPCRSFTTKTVDIPKSKIHDIYIGCEYCRSHMKINIRHLIWRNTYQVKFSNGIIEGSLERRA